jgi:hypothetical protein
VNGGIEGGSFDFCKRSNVPTLRLNVPTSRLNVPTLRLNVPTLRLNVPTSRLDVPTLRLNVPTLRLNVPTSRLDVPTLRLNVQISKRFLLCCLLCLLCPQSLTPDLLIPIFNLIIKIKNPVFILIACNGLI